MNGVNSLDELDRGTLWLCPECLRKLEAAIGFDIETRYRDLRAFLVAHGMTQPARWIDHRLAQLR